MSWDCKVAVPPSVVMDKALRLQSALQQALAAGADRVILSTEWQQREQAVDFPQQGARRRDRENISGADIAEAGVPQQRLGVAPPQQDRVLVERAGVDDVPGHRIERIVFENRKQSAGTKHAADVVDKCRPLRDGNVMKHAARERGINRLVGEGKVSPIEHFVAHAGIPLACGRYARRRNVDPCKRADVLEQLLMGIADSTADVEQLYFRDLS